MAKRKKEEVDAQTSDVDIVDEGGTDVAEGEAGDVGGENDDEGSSKEAEEAVVAEAEPAEDVPEGPVVRIQDGPLIAVPAGYDRQYRLEIGGRNFEHVSDETLADGRVIWVYRQM